MSQTPLFLAIFLIGLPLALALGPRRYPALCCALAFQVGLAAMVIAALLLLTLGLPYNAWTLGGLLLSAGAAAVWRRPVRLDRAAVLLIALFTAGFAAVAAVLSYWNLSAMSFDSHHIVMLGRIVGNDGALESRTAGELHSWGVFQVIAHSFMAFTRQDYLYSLQPVFGASFLPVFALSLWYAVGRLGATGPVRLAAVALITIALFTLYIFLFHLVFIHTNLGSAVYLFGFIVLFWLAELDEDPSGIPIAFLFLLSLALQRLETPLVALIALVPTVLTTALPRRAITPPMAAFTAFVALWFLQLALHLDPESPFLTPKRCVMVAAVVAGVFGWWMLSRTPRIARINRHLPWVMLGGGATVVILAFASAPEHMRISADAWLTNVFTLPHWGRAWYVLVAAVVVAFLIPAPPRHRAFTVTIWTFLAYGLILGYAREPYRISLLDSANRMTIHIVPLLFFYLGIKAIPWAARRDAAG